jgi:hypothetical protein
MDKSVVEHRLTKETSAASDEEALTTSLADL